MRGVVPGSPRRIALIAPGQGMEVVGMGLDVGAVHAEAAKILDIASEVVGRDVRRALRWGGIRFDETTFVQPALTAVALGAARALSSAGIRPDLVAGHSVGELAGWCVAGGCTDAEAIRLATKRGSAMARAALEHPGQMVAVREVPELPTGVVVAVDNPGSTVLSGPTAEIAGIRGTRVRTSGPWHSAAMAAAAPALATALADVSPSALRCPMVSNHDGAAHTDDTTIRAHLVAQLTSPVQWIACLRTVGELGVTDAVVLGPSKILRSHLRTTLPHVRVHRTDDARAIDTTRRLLQPV